MPPSGGWAPRANERGVDIAVHTHVNHAQPVTPLVGDAAQMVLDSGFRDVRNQGVLLRGVNTTAERAARSVLHAARPRRRSCPYYFYMCDMIPNAEHWRTSRRRDPGRCSSVCWATCPGSRPRAWCATSRSWASAGCTCWATTTARAGISYWTKNYRTGIEFDDPEAFIAPVPLLRPDLHAARRGPGVVAREDARRARRPARRTRHRTRARGRRFLSARSPGTGPLLASAA